MTRCLLILALLLSVMPSWGQEKTLTLATYTYATNNRLENLRPLGAFLSTWTGARVNVVSYPTVKALIRAINHDSVDLAMMNTSGYLVLQRNQPGKAIPLVNLAMGNAQQTNYGGCLLVTKNTGITSVDQLKGKKLRLALVASSSTSGNLVPRLLLNAAGIPDADKVMEVYYAGTHKKVVEDLLAGNADLGGCGCAEVDAAKRAGQFDSKLLVLADYNNIPLGPIVYRKGIDAQLIEKARSALLEVHRKDPAAFLQFCKGWTEFAQATQFTPVTDSAYDPFRQLFGDNQLLWRLIE
ncbi:MAG: PhnD/SsuA/transferrin family substrate-binding protein [Cyclobacteriaceae bacterium]|nr:PhnD/SsuA/transferrin family substrate-binding protein [Cyclobacteriaceae bacterium]